VTEEIGFEVHLAQPYEEAIKTVTAALKTQGFGVMTKIDVKATLKEKIGVDFRPYTILGTCNPPLAHRALSNDPQIGLMLPCNVTVEADPTGGSLVRIVNPEKMMGIGAWRENGLLCDVASDARFRLEQVAEALRG
jgi:uncharacterized protein (DUF302 family)